MKNSVWENIHFGRVALLPDAEKFSKIIKEATKKQLLPSNFGGCTAPSFVKKWQKRGQKTFALAIFSFFWGSLGLSQCFGL